MRGGTLGSRGGVGPHRDRGGRPPSPLPRALRRIAGQGESDGGVLAGSAAIG